MLTLRGVITDQTGFFHLNSKCRQMLLSRQKTKVNKSTHVVVHHLKNAWFKRTSRQIETFRHMTRIFIKKDKKEKCIKLSLLVTYLNK
jgi:hypothetical protein